MCALLSAACGGTADYGGTPSLCTCQVGPPAGEPAHDAGHDAFSEAQGGAPIEAGAAASEASTNEATTTEAGANETAPSDAPPDVTYPEHCYDGAQDGTETAVDCGGDCAGCGLGQACVTSADCGYGPGCDMQSGGCTCDVLARTCVYNHCSDHTFDGNETSVDCGGGVCPACGPGLGCNVDSDCSATAHGCDSTQGGCACDAISGLCIYSHCFDDKMDYGESDIDCGGPCAPCVLGKTCVGDSDCAMQACDAISLMCVLDPCADHRKDGQESDVDCGGILCKPCPVGAHCNTNFDAPPGHFCSAMHVVQ
jgi:hypothetical protein